MKYSFSGCLSYMNPRCILITGANRAGKTLISQALSTTREVEWLEEPLSLQGLMMWYGLGMIEKELFREMFSFYLKEMINELVLLRSGWSFRPGDYNSIWNAKDVKEIFDRMTNLSSRDEMLDYIEKNNKVFLVDLTRIGKMVGVIKEFMPETFIIHVVRDGYDAAVDCLKKPWYSDEYLMNPLGLGPYKTEKRRTEKGMLNIPYWVNDEDRFIRASRYERGLLYWCEAEDYDADADDLMIRYEDYIKDPMAVIDGICKTLNLTTTDKTQMMISKISDTFCYHARERISEYEVSDDIRERTDKIREKRGYLS